MMLMQVGHAHIRLKAEHVAEKRQLAHVAKHLKEKGVQFKAVITERDEVRDITIFLDISDIAEEWIEGDGVISCRLSVNSCQLETIRCSRSSASVMRWWEDLFVTIPAYEEDRAMIARTGTVSQRRGMSAHSDLRKKPTILETPVRSGDN